jgi:uncharacterized protein (TIGR00255 family)
LIKSMTGFASLTREDERGTIGITVRSVNHRFLDMQLRLPPQLAELEPRVRALVQRRLTRGRIELTLALQQRQGAAPIVELQQEFARALAAAIDVARESGLVKGELTPGDLLRLPQAFNIRDRSVECETLGRVYGATVEAALDAALDELELMRIREGDHLAADLDARRATVAQLIDDLEAGADAGRLELAARLAERVKELMAAVPADPVAVAQEIVRVAQRSDISEEITRFRGHLAHWTALASGEEPCGRKLDFLLQEMNREINTIASKADGVQVSELIIQAKAELERMREQVQNVE